MSKHLPQKQSIQDIELRSPCSPRSFHTYSRGSSIHVLFGTERGSLHYRSYDQSSSSVGGSTSKRGSSSGSSSSLTYTKRCDESVVNGGGSIVNVVMGSSSVAAPTSSNVVFCLLVDDRKYNSATSQLSSSASAYANDSDNSSGDGDPYTIKFMVFRNGSFYHTERRDGSSNVAGDGMPRVSSLDYHPSCGFVFTAGNKVQSLSYVPSYLDELVISSGVPSSISSSFSSAATLASYLPNPLVSFYSDLTSSLDNGKSSAAAGLDLPGGTSFLSYEQTAPRFIKLVCEGRVAIVFANHSFFGVPSISSTHESPKRKPSLIANFSKSSQLHSPVIMEFEHIDPSSTSSGKGNDADVYLNMTSKRAITSMVLLTCGRDFTACEVLFDTRHSSLILAESDLVATLKSPILDASSVCIANRPLAIILTSDGLAHVRSPSCIEVPLATIELGTKLNDYFLIQKLPGARIIAASYSGDARIVAIKEDSMQDKADRMMKLSIDAFGANRFPRTQLAEAIGATFSATSYVGTEPSDRTKSILKKYLGSLLGLTSDVGNTECWLDDQSPFENDPMSSSLLISGTALLSYTCAIMKSPNGTLACRAARLCVTKATGYKCPSALAAVCANLADEMLKLVSASWSLISGHNKKTILGMEFVETSLWLLRLCGKYDRAIDVLNERMDNPNKYTMGGWSYTKYESYTTRMLEELWSSGDKELASLALNSPTTKKILEVNPKLGLTIFTQSHPQDEKQWEDLKMNDDPLLHVVDPLKVVDMLKNVDMQKSISTSNMEAKSDDNHSGVTSKLSPSSGLAMAINYLESAIGLTSDRRVEEGAFSRLPGYDQLEERTISCHDELIYLLLEGVLKEKKSVHGKETDLGRLFQSKLRHFLGWPLAKFRSQRVLNALPTSFLREHALLLGRLGRHDEALRILYTDLKSVDLALKYCDMRYSRQRSTRKQGSNTTKSGDITSLDCPYLPLVKAALDSSSSEEGTASAISIISKRRDVIDSGAALRLLPGNVPLSAIARSFLIPALVESESEVRRLQIAAFLLRAKYINMRRALTDAQLASQLQLHNVEALRTIEMGEQIRSSSAFVARTSGSPASSFPKVMLVKHFFPRHLVIEARVSNVSIDSRTLGSVAFVVAESSDESAVASIVEVSIKTLPVDATGSAWCALTVAPQRLDTVVSLTCELRYKILNGDVATGVSLNFGDRHGFGANSTRTFVEELQDIEVRHSEFKYN